MLCSITRTQSVLCGAEHESVSIEIPHIPVAWAASRSLAAVPGFVACTLSALTRTENRAPVFCRRSLMPLYSHDIAHGMAPKSWADANEPNIVLDWPGRVENEKSRNEIFMILASFNDFRKFS